MGPITYEILETNGLNALVKYMCDGEQCTVGARFPLDATPETIEQTIKMYTPMMYFEDKLNPVAVDALSSMVGISGTVQSNIELPPIESSVQQNLGDNVLVIKDI